MLRVGLTGGIACGKSHVLERLGLRGFRTLDLDATAREVTGPGSPALAEIVAAFGRGVLSGEAALDRGALAAIVYGDPAARARLDEIVHPRVRAAEAAWAAACAGEDDVLVTDGALLVEAGVHLRFDRLIVVHCDRERQLQRLQARDRLGEREARARVDAQMPLLEKRAFAHHVIDTSGGFEETDRAVEVVAGELPRVAGRQALAPPRSLPRVLAALAHGPRSGPRGLSPSLVLESILERGCPEMSTLSRLLRPGTTGPWYSPAGATPAGASAATLAVPLVGWAVGRRATDPAFLAAAAHSLARLTHAEGWAIADACLFALVLEDVVTGADPAKELDRLIALRLPLAESWGRASRSPQLDPVWAAVRRFPNEPMAAAAACRARGGEPGLAGALAGAAAGAAPAERSWEEALGRLGLRP